ncbi:MAG: dihydropteroate synthase [Bacteroidetes bacterium]|nr:dihydropteroate synthase [Bacteroidota bacterium]MCA6442613.1 dihydropteroate synthase [Bacteroidota bacterium]
MEVKNNEIITNSYLTNGKILSFDSPKVMAIVNLTPNSFYDGNKYESTADVLKDIEVKLEQGADIIDIGAASTKPGEKLIHPDEEWMRLEKSLTAIRKEHPNQLLSIDTYNSQTALKAANCGIDIINDVSGGNFDAAMFSVVVKLNLAYVLMHIKGQPENMQLLPTYHYVVEDVYTHLEQKVNALNKLYFNKIILDVGFGFGKSLDDNYRLLKELSRFSVLGFPILAGLSRKSMINKVISTNPVTSLNGTTVLNTLALQNGAKFLRVHDVMEAKQTIQLFLKYQSV